MTKAKMNESEPMENHKLVMPENLNHFGFLFGGYMLKWVDEIAWIAATLEYPGYTFVTIGMDEVVFKTSVREGTILKFTTTKTRVGRTSVDFQVHVTDGINTAADLIFSTTVTMVRVDEKGQKKQIQS
jgi:acyl-CoA hydrolase